MTSSEITDDNYGDSCPRCGRARWEHPRDDFPCGQRKASLASKESSLHGRDIVTCCRAHQKREPLLRQAADEIERLDAERLDVWAAIAATDVGQGLAWNVSAMVRLSRERRDELDALRSEVRELRAALYLSRSLAITTPELIRLRNAGQITFDKQVYIIIDCLLQQRECLAGEPHQHVYDVRNPGVCESSGHETGLKP